MIVLSIESFFGETFGGENWAYAWLPLCLLAIMSAITIYTILLMVGRAFSIRELEAFAKSEILQSAATAFMAIFLVVIINGAMVLTSQFIAGDVTCSGESIHIPYALEGENETGQMAMDEAFDAIRCRLQQRATEIAEIQGAIMGGNSVEFNRLNIALSSFGITFFKGDWVGDWYEEVETKRITSNLATTLLVALNAQSAILQYIKGNMIHVFIPLGILLRSFFFTRNVGALFISMGLGMYFIFPIFFILLDPGFTPAPPVPDFEDPGENQMYCYPTMSNVVSMIQNYEAQGGNALQNLQMQQLSNDLSQSYVSLIMHPLIALFLTMTFIRYLMTVLGGDTHELTRMLTKVV
ncbi:hypothetical protein GF318_01285 [Candidatus Micrarchaeota archaeon]|nr:hypothetical protein [Candidatus Micrarchaeota archaeon]